MVTSRSRKTQLRKVKRRLSRGGWGIWKSILRVEAHLEESTFILKLLLFSKGI